MSTDKSNSNDTFADIAAQQIVYRDSSLIEPEPTALPDIRLPVGKPSSETDISPVAKIADEQALTAELEAMRERYAPFMQKLSPAVPETRIAVPIEKMDWRVQTEEDQADFLGVLSGSGSWEEVRIPHYGPPLGKATTYYRTTLQITEEQLALGAAFICFKGVDYKAHAFLNGTFLGSHEGFFAPFEFECSAYAHVGENTLVVRVENDYLLMGNQAWLDNNAGEKIYAATGLGYDDPELGWHHCPPGMGIYQDACMEFRARCFVNDIFVRPLPKEGKAELWFEVFGCDSEAKDLEFNISIFGRNFDSTIIKDFAYAPEVIHECGEGDALQIARAKAAGIYRKPEPLKIGPGRNRFIVSINMDDFRWWTPETPWLYQAQVQVVDHDHHLIDAAEGHFGMRSFRMDETSDPKGALYFNDKPVRLRGANTMGHEQQCVFHKDFDQLRDDILLAKICNMNFLRLTQRPVQPEIYDYCDMLGLMTQSDLPTFAVIRRPLYCEALRQVEEVERLTRSHPCNIMISYINEPLNHAGNQPHRHLNRPELEEFFDSADKIVHQLNPERVAKACDGDYDPPSPGIQDRHCYCTWYNGQGVDIGRLHKGYWQPTKAGWYYGCGEFGAEGLEASELMKREYPTSWLPEIGKDDADWSPNSIRFAQTGRFHYFFFETPEGLEEWISESQNYQAESMQMMTEAFRRDNHMATIAIHLFIDAFPSGWMKTIMDCDRRPKQAYFAYRNALAPVLPNLRTDRSRVFAGEDIEVEAWICNDLPGPLEDMELRYQFEQNGVVLSSGKAPATANACEATFQGILSLPAPQVTKRGVVTARLALVDTDQNTVNDSALEIEVFPAPGVVNQRAFVLGRSALQLANEMQIEISEDAPVILADNLQALEPCEDDILERVKSGARLVLLDAAPGTHQIGGHEFTIKPSGFNDLHFASRRTGHPMVEGFKPHDFRHWYDPALGYITPIIQNTLTAENAAPILLSGNTDDNGEWNSAMAAAEILHGKGSIIICQVALAGRTTTNPPAQILAERLLRVPAESIKTSARETEVILA